MRPRGGLRVRLIGLVTVVSVLVLGALALSFNIAFRSSLNGDADKILRARANAELDTLVVDGSRIAPRDHAQRGPIDSRIWVYDGARVIERAPASPPVQRLADELSTSTPGVRLDPVSETRLLSVPILERGDRVGTVVAALSAEPYEKSASRALVFSLILVGVAALLIVGMARLLVDRALRPVTAMTEAAMDWTEHDVDHRFNAGEPHDELTGLAATFDGMLDRLAASLRHEQRFSAEVSHELRTPLAAILAEAELALRRERSSPEYRDALARIASKATQLRRILETLLMAERADLSLGHSGADAAEIATRAIAVCGDLAQTRGVTVDWSPAAVGLRVDVDADVGERILAPLIDNACRYAHSRVQVAVRAGGRRATFAVRDDGPGIAPEERESVFAPGYRGAGASAKTNGDGAGLGLALSRRLASAVGGEVAAAGGPEGLGGACFEVKLPLIVAG